jgi:hypothetical protein
MEGLGLHECQQEVRLALMEQSTATMGKQVSEIYKAVVGNGTKGLKVEHELLKQEVDEIKGWQTRQDNQKATRWGHIIALWIAVAAVVVGELAGKIL